MAWGISSMGKKTAGGLLELKGHFPLAPGVARSLFGLAPAKLLAKQPCFRKLFLGGGTAAVGPADPTLSWA